MANPFTYDLGISQGRIQPQNAGFGTMQDGDFVFCLGSDLLPAPDFDLAIGDQVEVTRNFTTDGTQQFLRGAFRTRQPDNMPVATVLPGVVSISRTVTTVLPVTRDVSRIHTSVDFFTADMTGRVCRLAGTPAPFIDGDYIIETIDRTVDDELDPRVAILQQQARTDTGAALNIAPGTAVLVGARWVYRVLIDGDVYATLQENDGRSRIRDLAINISKLVPGDHTLTFRLLLEEP